MKDIRANQKSKITNSKNKKKEEKLGLFTWKIQLFLLFFSFSILIVSTSQYFKFSKPLVSSPIKWVFC